MNNPVFNCRQMVVLMVALSALVGAGRLAYAEDVKVNLSGNQEVPAVSTSASGSGTFTIGEDHSVSGSVTTTGIAGTAAHIHMAASGQNGGVIVPLIKKGENEWTVSPGVKLTDQQYQAFKDGNLYVNVHSAAHPSGEIRAQLKP